MRRFLSLLTMFMLVSILAFAQSRVVTGKVTNTQGKPVSFASVTLANGTGTQADANGEFSVRVNTGDRLTVSSASYDPVTVVVGAGNNLNVTLETKANTIEEVVVTSAFQTKRVARSVSSNVQQISGEKLNTTRTANINNALAGKVAGAQVRSQASANLGRETAVRLRGENGLGAGGGPIYVVDGTITTSSNDINPDDIDDMTVLQGPAATALFGPEGSNGAIVVNLKRARKTAGLGIEVNSAVSYDKIYITPRYQDSYAGGAEANLIKYSWKPGDPVEWKALDGKYYHDYTDDASWGPRMVGQEYIPWYAWYGGHEWAFKTAPLVPQPNNAKDYFETGVTLQNNISFTKSAEGFNLRASYSNLSVKGLIPGSKLNRHNFNTVFGIDVTPKLKLTTSFTYMNQKRQAENDDGYSNQTTGSFSQWFHRDIDMEMMRKLRGLRTPGGIYASWNHNNPGSYNATNPLGFYGGNYWFNFYSYYDLINNTDIRDRLMGDVALSYKLTKSLSLKGTYRRNQLATSFSSVYPLELEQSATQSTFNPWEGNGKAGYGVGNAKRIRQNYEFLASYGKKFREFNVNANAGLDILKDKSESLNSNTVGGLNVPNLYSIANSVSTPKTNPGYSDYKRNGMFVRADFGYKNMIFVEGALRRDYASAEPKGTFINTHAYGASFVFSELIKSSVLSFGKIRASAGKTIAALGAYSTYNTYAPVQASIFAMGEPNNLIDPKIHGSTNSEKEIGIETRWLKDRFGFTATYYDRTNKDFPVNVAINPASGYTSYYTNAGKMTKKGIEASAFVNPIRRQNLDWRIEGTWAYNLKNVIDEIAPGVNRLVVASGAFSGSSAAYTVSQVGQEWGQMFGNGIKRNANGKAVLTSAGLYTKEDTVKFGSVLPRYTGGIQNTIKFYKNFALAFNIDFQSGGKYFSLSDHWGSFSGLSARTAALNDKGMSVRDAVADGGGVRVDGVDATGKDVTYYVDAQTYFHQFRNANISEPFIYDLTFVKMRELSLSYNLPVEKMGIGKNIRNITFSVIARNPWLIYTTNRDFDPSEISSVYGEDGQMPGTRSVGVNLKVGF